MQLLWKLFDKIGKTKIVIFSVSLHSPCNAEACHELVTQIRGIGQGMTATCVDVEAVTDSV